MFTVAIGVLIAVFVLCVVLPVMIYGVVCVFSSIMDLAHKPQPHAHHRIR
jgi:ABC-type transport system involved in cytochrome c biogenesis permease component